MPLDGIQNGPLRELGQRPAASSSASKESVDKDAFLKLLVAQLKAQDPLSPMEGTQFVQQLATFSQVEQAISQTKHLEMLSLQLSGLQSNEAVGLIGKEVTVKGKTIAFDGTNPTGFSTQLNGDAAATKVTIVDAAGAPVRTLELGPQAQGPVPVPWDGRNDAGKLVPPGSYSVQVEATDAAGEPVVSSNEVKGRVVGVSFDKGYPEVILDSGARAPISDLVAVHGTTVGPSGLAGAGGLAAALAGLKPSPTETGLAGLDASIANLAATPRRSDR
ncbi:MAG: flagellar hook assembly protein FlgD [Deltaproteobacteria bacterium]|nr:flagellar hook assembly protein FlgD [Deltaproteobacteria bacterium]